MASSGFLTPRYLRLKPWLMALVMAVLITLLGLLASSFYRFAPTWVYVLFGAFTFIAVWGLTELLFYGRLRRIERHLQQAVTRVDKDHSRYRGDTIEKISKGVAELVVVTQRELRNLKEQETFRREFIGDVSHELKTPLFAIQGFVDTLLDGALEDSNVNRKFLKQARKNVIRLNNLVQDLMIISQIESGDLQMQMEEFRLYDLLLDVIDYLDYKRTKGNRDVSIHIEPNGLEQQRVEADPDRIRQVLINLIDNAIKYGDPRGSVHVRLIDKPERLEIAIRDEGEGIPAEHLPYIFGRFYRVDKSRSRERGGTGLGLSIVKNMLEAHGETCRVTSSPTEGTTFTFGLPKAG